MGADRHLRTVLASSLATVLLLSACDSSDTGQQARTQPTPDKTSAAGGTADPTTAPSTTPRAADYPCGLTNYIDGHQVIRYCGPARARIALEENTVVVDGGNCEQRGDFLLVNLGTNYSAEDNAAGSYIGLLMSPANPQGVYDAISTMELTVDGRRINIGSADAELSIDKRQVAGTIDGRSAGAEHFRIVLSCRVQR